MEIQDLGAVGEFVSSVVITATLIFLVLETRNAKFATLQGNRQLRQQIQNSIHLGFAGNSLLSTAITKANAQLSPEFGVMYEAQAQRWGLEAAEYAMVVNQLRAEFRFIEGQFFTQLPDTDRRTIDMHLLTIMRGPVWSQFWKEQRHFFDVDFRKYVDNLVTDSGVSIGFLPDDFESRI